SNPEGEVAIWRINLAPGASITLPAAERSAARRTLYFHIGREIEVDGQHVPGERLIEVEATAPLALANPSDTPAEILLLQGVPIGEPVVAQGPFVMNTAAEIDQARRDFGRTQFGGWPWTESGPVHPAGQGRFARYPGETEPQLPPAA